MPISENAVSLIHGLSRISVAWVWLYHGLVPKLLGPHKDEISMAVAHGLSDSEVSAVLKQAGALEVIFGAVLLILWSSRWPFLVSGLLMIVLLIDVALFTPQYLAATFNPVSTNISVIALSVIGYLTTRGGA